MISAYDYDIVISTLSLMGLTFGRRFYYCLNASTAYL